MKQRFKYCKAKSFQVSNFFSNHCHVYVLAVNTYEELLWPGRLQAALFLSYCCLDNLAVTADAMKIEPSTVVFYYCLWFDFYCIRRYLKSNQTFYKNCHCDSIIDFMANSFFIVQIYHAKSFKMKYIRSLYLRFFKDILKDT